MGPACGIAMYDGDILHVWSHSQGIYPMRRAMASMLNMREENIHIISVPGAGCFGHSTADDAAADAALIALSIPGKHVRVQWPRADEFANDPYGSAVITKLQASLSKEGNISAWKTDVWSDSHSTRPNDDGGTLLPARYLEKPRKMKSRGYLGGGHRNGDPYYAIPNLQLNAHYFNGPLRVSSLRSLGAYTNIFAIESFMDELALKAGTHPLDFRLNHLEDERAISIIEKIRKTTDSVKTNKSEGLGYAFMRYKNAEGYVAVAAIVHVDNKEKRISLKKLWATVDVGEVINIDGIKNQIEGGLIQSASWALKEKVKFNASGITSTQWSDYPIFTFEDIPEIIVELIIRPEEPAMGIGEIILPPVAAAIGNAIFDASGIRLYDLPFRLNEN